MTEKLLVKFAVSKQLPIVGFNFECTTIAPNGHLKPETIIPTNVSPIDTNIAKLKTNEENVTYIVMFPTLLSNKTYVGMVKTLPYLGDVLKYEEIGCTFNVFNNADVHLEKYNSDSPIKSVKKCSDNVFLVFTDNNMYILMKDSTKTEN